MRYRVFIYRNKLLTIPSTSEAVVTRTNSLLNTNVKSRKLIGVIRVVMDESLKSHNRGAKFWTKNQRHVAAKTLVTSILTTKSVKLQTECMSTHMTRVTLHMAPLPRQFGAFILKYGTVVFVPPLIRKEGFATGYYLLQVMVTRKSFIDILDPLNFWERPIFVSADGRKSHLWTYVTHGHLSMACQRRNPAPHAKPNGHPQRNEG